MNTKILKVLLFASLLICSGCERLDIGGIFGGSHPHHDGRFNESMAWNKVYSTTTGLEEGCLAHIYAKENTYTVYWAADLHIAGEGQTHMMDTFINMALGNYLIDSVLMPLGDTCTAVIFAGDIIDAKNNYPVFYHHLKPLEDAGVPIFCTPGNHDLCFSQWAEYAEYWHTSCYWFDIITPSGKKDLYISCDSGDATLGAKQFNWLKDLLERKSREGYRHIIFFTHTHMFKRDSNQAHAAGYNMEEIYELTYLFSKYGVDYYICGHDHTHEETRYKNVIYYTIGAMKNSFLGKAAYMTMTIYDSYGQDLAPIHVQLHRMSGENYLIWD